MPGPLRRLLPGSIPPAMMPTTSASKTRTQATASTLRGLTTRTHLIFTPTQSSASHEYNSFSCAYYVFYYVYDYNYNVCSQHHLNDSNCVKNCTIPTRVTPCQWVQRRLTGTALEACRGEVIRDVWRRTNIREVWRWTCDRSIAHWKSARDHRRNSFPLLAQTVFGAG